MIRWLSRWGFAALVGLGVVAAIWAAATVDLPREIPSFALQAASVYRLEVGVAFFAAVYLGSMALALALNNRAFSEIGTTGIRAHGIHELGNQELAEHALERSIGIPKTELRESQEGRE